MGAGKDGWINLSISIMAVTQQIFFLEVLGVIKSTWGLN